MVEPLPPRGPHLDPAALADRTLTDREHEGAGAPAVHVTVLEKIQLAGLRMTEAFIRLLATPARFTP
jgi:hypothetical protein